MRYGQTKRLIFSGVWFLRRKKTKKARERDRKWEVVSLSVGHLKHSVEDQILMRMSQISTIKGSKLSAKSDYSENREHSWRLSYPFSFFLKKKDA